MDESVVKEFEQQQVGKLNLSRAIRIGAKMHPQGHHLVFDGSRTCALGAAAVGRGWPASDLWADRPHDSYLSDVQGTSLWREIGARNDRGESREQIADWLESKGL